MDWLYFFIRTVHLVWLLITLLVLVWFWTWFLNQVFSRLKQMSFWKFLMRGGILVGLLFAYEQFFSFFDRDKQLYFIREAISVPSVAGFLGYGLLVVSGVTLIFGQYKKKKIWLQIFVGILSLLIVVLGGVKLGLTTLVLYYLLAAFTEEIFKFTLGNNQSEASLSPSRSQLLLFSLLIAFSFSIVENLLAFWIQLFHGEMISSGMLLWRGLMASLVHCVATGLIALLLIKGKKIWLFWNYSVALFVGFFFHSVYNLSLVWGLSWLAVLVAVLWGVGLSYLLFNLDELYE